MASIKVKFRPSTVADHEGTIYYQIIHQRKVRQLISGYHIHAAEWDEKRSCIISGKNVERNAFIMSVRDRVRHDIDRFSCMIRQYECKGLDYTVDELIENYSRYVNENTLLNYMERIITSLKRNGKYRTAETYSATLNSFRRFLHETKPYPTSCLEDDIMLDCITPRVMEAYEAWHHKRGVVPNTISFYLRILRAVYNRAAEAGIMENCNPFRHVYTGIDKTIKRALPLQAIRNIKSLDLSRMPQLDYARDIFVMSFMLRGMSFIDMAYLRKKDLHDGYIAYRRRKTGQLLTIKWTKEMQTILDKYPDNVSDYLLPILRHPGINTHYAYRNISYNINRNLKKIAAMAGISGTLTLYVARHSWASAAKAKKIPLSVISEGLGHDCETTTQIYLASLDTSVIDRANHLILRSL